ncbi:DUF1330 domain-containing protein [Haliea sp. E17]|uniref:DUF1330 domain-containing protein n=1 Tax=Haliea sp. E17 TaxID=3401576 RepID=UPI003AB00199
MTAYVIVYQESEIRDPDSYAEYQKMTREARGDFDLTPLAVYGKTEALEGHAPEGVIVLKFPSVAEAKAWYNSPAYQAALPKRLQAADYRTIIVEGL